MRPGAETNIFSWGESAGASSVGLHLVVNDGDTGGLFRGAVMVIVTKQYSFTFNYHNFLYSNPVLLVL